MSGPVHKLHTERQVADSHVADQGERATGTESERAELKGVFALLVEKCGGAVACGARLGISHQRICTLQSADNDQLPSFMKHILPLEQWRHMPVVTGYYARKAGGGLVGEAMEEAMEAIEAVVDMGKIIRTGGDQKARIAACQDALAQLQDVLMALHREGLD